MVRKEGFEYRTTYAVVPDNFPNYEALPESLAKLSPKPPKGEDWQLAGCTSVHVTTGNVVLYFWERPVTFQEVRT